MKLAIIPCSAAKRDYTTTAADMYLGSFHQLARDAAETLVEDGHVDGIRILSAKYGLVQLGQLVDPYEQKLTRGDLGQLAALVSSQLERETTTSVASHVKGDSWVTYSTHHDLELELVALTPKLYAEALGLAAVDWLLGNSTGRAIHVQRPLASCTGIGYQRQVLARIREGVSA